MQDIIRDIDNKKPEKKPKVGVLYIVSTPIGNDDDISLRAIKVLQKCDVVICEEFKIGSRTLRKLNISKKLESLTEQNEREDFRDYIELLKQGKKVALISDAGTPLFADPGLYLVREAIRQKFNVVVVPGASSIMAALVRSGFSTNQFLYAGFLSRKTEERIVQLRRLSDESRTVVLLETPYRLMPVLEAAKKLMPDRRAYLGINLTMPFETHHYGTFRELYDKFAEEKFKGEFVICFEGRPYSSKDNFNKGPVYKKSSSHYKGVKFSNERPGEFKKDRNFRDRGRQRK